MIKYGSFLGCEDDDEAAAVVSCILGTAARSASTWDVDACGGTRVCDVVMDLAGSQAEGSRSPSCLARGDILVVAIAADEWVVQDPKAGNVISPKFPP